MIWSMGPYSFAAQTNGWDYANWDFWDQLDALVAVIVLNFVGISPIHGHFYWENKDQPDKTWIIEKRHFCWNIVDFLNNPHGFLGWPAFICAQEEWGFMTWMVIDVLTLSPL